ncbi:Uncharacterised protein [Mycobacteroides abscessus subsp. abscessus]|nr:Uncharacterised protein [Mycobacteroides abscessus subsp. abscessus]
MTASALARRAVEAANPITASAARVIPAPTQIGEV